MQTVKSGRHNAEEYVFFFCFSFSVPDGENPAEIVHDVVEFNLQVFQDVAGLLAQLKKGHRNTTAQS